VSARSLILRASVTDLAGVRAFIREAALAEGGTRRAAEDLVQAVDEAVCNVIRHGAHGRDSEVMIEAERRDDTLAVRILDRAPLFDPTLAAPPDLSVPPIDRRPGGMGIHLLTTMVDEVHHRARPGGGNELVLIRRLDAGAEPDRTRGPESARGSQPTGGAEPTRGTEPTRGAEPTREER